MIVSTLADRAPALIEAVLGALPPPVRRLLLRHHELVKFALVGGTTFFVDLGIFYALKLTVLEPKPVTAKIISGTLAMILSYIFNREWSFKTRGGRQRHHEAMLFFIVSGIGVVLGFIPLWISSYGLGLRAPNISLLAENIADFVSAYVVGNLLQMGFRFWAFRRFVFPDEYADNPEPDELPVRAE